MRDCEACGQQLAQQPEPVLHAREVVGSRPAAPEDRPAGRLRNDMRGGLADDQLVTLLQRYLTILQGHPAAEEMMEQVLTEDFETGFVGGHLWRGIEGLRDFLSQRDGFFDEKHTIDELLERSDSGDGITARTRLHFFLRSWRAP